MLNGELKKLFSVKIFIIFIVFLLVKILMPYILSTSTEYDFSKEFYKDYCQKYDGIYTDKKSDDINNEIEKLNMIISKQTDMESNYVQGKITFEEFNKYNKSHTYAENHLPALEKIQEKAKYFKKISTDKTPEFFYDLNCIDFFKNFKMDSVCIFFLIFMVTNYYFLDKENQLCDLIQTTYNGRKKYRKKQAAATAMFTILFTILFSIYDIINFIIKCGYEAFARPICSIEQFENCNYNLSIIEFLFLNSFTKIVWCIFLSFFILVCAKVIYQFTTTIIIQLIIIFIPLIFETQIPSALHKFLIGKQLSSYGIINNQLALSFIICTIFICIFYSIFLFFKVKN